MCDGEHVTSIAPQSQAPPAVGIVNPLAADKRGRLHAHCLQCVEYQRVSCIGIEQRRERIELEIVDGDRDLRWRGCMERC